MAAARVTVPGVKKVWATKKDASTTVVIRTTRQLTKIDPKKLTVKRKFMKVTLGGVIDGGFWLRVLKLFLES